MPNSETPSKATELEVKLSTALSSLYKMTYYYFRKSANASVELQAKRARGICSLLDSIEKEFSSISRDVIREENNSSSSEQQ